jgi:hypothetical protein
MNAKGTYYYSYMVSENKQNFLSISHLWTSTFMHFDIVHSDLWTSPVLSSGGHRNYVLFFDDFTNFL